MKHRNRVGKYSVDSVHSGRKLWPVWQVALIDALVVGVVLLVFAFFHHVLPALISQSERNAALEQNPPVVTESVETEAPTEVTQTSESFAENVPEETVDPNLTPWQIKFADQFSDEVVLTENSYKSPNISVTVETITKGEGDQQQTYHVADIYIASIENFTTYTANGEMRYFATQDVLEMNEASNAILSISGDFLTYQKQGFLMRNGEIYRETTNNVNICALFSDGTIETYEAREFDIADIKNRGALQVWSFGPVLLDENGHAKDDYLMSHAVSMTNPRSAIGYYEPGHYCFVVVDGRQAGYSKGMSIPELAAVFEELGCTKAYNLDGGGSAVMVFNHERYSKQSNGGDRALGDILLIREVQEVVQ